MTVSPTTQAVLLLTAHFSKSRSDSAKPLTHREWGRFAVWLKDHALSPEQLLVGRPGELLAGWSDRQITTERVEALLNRGPALAVAVEKWLRAGLWVMTRSDADYPNRLKKKLGQDSPAILYGCGNRSLLQTRCLAVVGSRDASEADLKYSREIGSAAANQGYTVVSGGARGVDEAAMLGALDCEGTVVGVLANNLLRACTSSKYRRHVLDRNLVLASHVNPEARFSAGHAMQRNKYVYCLADAALVIHSGIQGGTWNGATENLAKYWVPLWIKPTKDIAAGNSSLAKRGGRWLPEKVDDVNIETLVQDRDGRTLPASAELTMQDAGGEVSVGLQAKHAESCAMSSGRPTDVPVAATETLRFEERRTGDLLTEPSAPAPVATVKREFEHRVNPIPSDAVALDDDPSFYAVFLKELSKACTSSAKTPDELAESLDLVKSQLNLWLKRALADGKLRKRLRPVRYEWVEEKQSSMFE